MPDYERIKAIRWDMSDWVLHLTKSFDLLKQIVRDGYLKPGLAPRKSVRDDIERPTIRGPHPAVCFSEMPLWAVKALAGAPMTTQRYFPFGLAFQKRRLFMKGARPVIYSNTDVLGPELGLQDEGYVADHRVHCGGLPRGMQYLWVRLDLENEGQSTDWTHEREWRCKVDPAFIAREGLPGVPLELGAWRDDRPTNFKIVVKTVGQEQDIRQLVGALPNQAPAGVHADYWAAYLARMRLRLDIAVVDQVVGPDDRTGRVETYF